ncbi:MAG: hypothetical protein CSA05_01775 [Bacteroidia bacterium]|nr:MAG: hypothetical protein CSA05_01775 [Bacteroidia bacterium]
MFTIIHVLIKKNSIFGNRIRSILLKTGIKVLYLSPNQARDMRIDSIYNFFNELKDDDFSLIYYGSANDVITDILIKLSEVNITDIREMSQIRKKVSFLMAECFQNIVRHGKIFDDVEKDLSSKHFFFTRSISKTYYFISANLVENTKVSSLRKKLKKVNDLDAVGLKEFYLEVLKNEQMSAQGGAGLGLIEMARKSGQKLKFDFVKLNSKYSYFFLQVFFNGKGVGETDKNILISTSKKIQKEIDSENIILLHRDNFSQESIKPVLQMIEKNMNKISEKGSMKKRVFHVLVEVLQNISKHAHSINDIRDGIFILAHENDNYIFRTGNYILNSGVQALKSVLDYLNTQNKTQLNVVYKRRLREAAINPDEDIALGLIDICRESMEKIKYKFIRVDEQKSFFLLSVKL